MFFVKPLVHTTGNMDGDAVGALLSEGNGSNDSIAFDGTGEDDGSGK
jgi:hypothetical protein